MSTHPRPFRAGPIEAVVDPGQNVLVVDRESYRLYQIAFIEEIPPSHPLVANVGAVIAGATAAVFSTTALLDMQDGQVGQFRARVLDDIHATILQPQALARFATMNVNATLNAFGALYDPCNHLSEFFVFEDERIFLRVTNPTDYNLAQTRVSFYGFRYILSGPQGLADPGGHVKPFRVFGNIEEAHQSGEKFTVIPVGGWGR